MTRFFIILLLTLSIVQLAYAQDKPMTMTNGIAKPLPAGKSLQLNPATSGTASLNVPQGIAPSSPNDGDIWTTAEGLSYRAGGVTRKILDNLSQCTNILHYGADRTGTLASDAAFTAAVSLSQAGKICLYFPAGTYRFTSTKTVTLNAAVTTASITLAGDGADVTLLNFSGGTSGISITLNSAYQSFHIQDLSVLGGTYSQSTQGITVTQSATISNPAYSAASDITRVVVRGNDGYAQQNGFKTAVKLDSVSNVSLVGGYISGPGDIAGKLPVCLELVGRTNTNGVVFNISNATINSCDVGLYLGSSIEGVTVSQSNFVGNNYGIYNSPTATDGVQLAVTTSHFNNYVAGIYLTNDPGGVSITNNYIIVNSLLRDAYGVFIGTTRDFLIYGNIFAPQSSNGEMTGILIGTYSTFSSLIQANVFHEMTSGVNLTNGSQYVTVGTNSYFNMTTDVINNGSNNNIVKNCTGTPTASFKVVNGLVVTC